MAAKLTYFNGRGRAEVVRYVLAGAGIEFTEEFLEKPEDIEALRATGKLIFRQVPLLEIDGRAITQTEAMIRYIARNYGLYGSSEDEMIRCDMIYDGLKDAQVGLCGVKMEFLPSDVEKEANKKQMKEKIAKYFPMLQGFLADNNGKFLVGDRLSFVDLVFLHDLEWVQDCLGEEILKEYATIQAYRFQLQSLPNVAKYLASPQKKNY
eukprot:CAMPEP_0206195582 /NCGR_PEP_ID=MMETSP0166-20121206/7931_1 /ASSEMBLY_ACC=CAM_ASM_000260 /TAXON_ID=95228 /ORGANISM="Vannella robusta, Strain DIVA3 518/3/11/1/6" /LENGTH=207 /DNA_ID=CAMNT_0053612879 /DNA_START=163 /DNA_END=783 /DNA_ORIENTATION=-